MSDDGYRFTSDWFSANIPIWEGVLGEFKGKPGLRALEIGSYQGRSAVWLLDNILTHPDSRIDCIDTFEGAIEHSVEESRTQWDLFQHNIRRHGAKVRVHRGMSQHVLRRLPVDEPFDIVYVDGDHTASSVLSDAVLTFPLLKVGGILIFDDYRWEMMEREIDCPAVAINAFFEIFQDELKPVHGGYQVMFQKRVPAPRPPPRFVNGGPGPRV